MSKRITLKRIALVAASALGFGLMSVVPASAAVASFTLDVDSTPVDSTIEIIEDTSTAGAQAFSIYTRNSTIALTEILVNPVGTFVTGDPVTLAAGTTTTLDDSDGAAATVYLTKAGDNDVEMPEAALSTYTATGAFTSLTASASGTSYVLWMDEDANQKITPADEEYATLTVYQSTATNLATTITNTTAEKNVSCRVAVTCSIAIDGTVTGSTTNNKYYSTGIATAFTSQPSGASTIYPTLTAEANLAVDSDLTVDSTKRVGSASNVAALFAESTINDDIATLTDSKMATVTFVPSAVGTYSLTVWAESATSLTANSALSGTESYGVFSITVSAGVATISTSVIGGNASISAATDGANGTDYGSWGSLLKITIKDANGVAAALANGEICSVDPSGTGDVSAVNGVVKTSTAGAAYNLAPGDFTNGVAYVNIADATAETVTAAITCGSATATSTHVFKTVDNTGGDWEVNPTALSTGWKVNSDPTILVPVTSSVSYTLVGLDDTDFTATEFGGVRVYDQDGSITGLAGAVYDMAILNDGAFTIAVTEKTAGGVMYELTNVPADSAAAAGSQALVVTTAARDVAAAGITVSPSAPRVAVAGSVELAVTVKDQFGVAYANGRVTLSLTGRNGTQAAQTGTTDSTGVVTFTVTDTALATSTLTSDTVTITAFDETNGANPTTAPVITWSSVAVKTVTLTADDEDSTIAGTVSTDISAAGAGATGSSSAPYATVKDADGNVLAGVAVTFAISDLTGAELHTTKVTVYTNASGIATTAISSYAAGKVTVTATAGGVSDTDDVYFKQTTATEARTISATTSGSGVVATVKDRYGNVIEGVTVNATRASGSGFFANGSSTTSGPTDKNGQVEFKFDGTGEVKVAFTAEDYGQSADAEGKVGITAVTAATAGTTTANQKGLGAALAPAGVNSATVSIATVNDAQVAAEAASDAAAEAIDAANAATDAANLAAEAADAATVAAEEARDAADAATAAVEELATQVATLMAALKAQITTLANTVAKIAKKVKVKKP